MRNPFRRRRPQETPRQASSNLSPLAQTLAKMGFAENWYRWCDSRRDWSTEAQGTYEQDSLLSQYGGYSPLDLKEFMQAFRDAGATVTKGSALSDGRHRSFTVEVAEEPVLCSLAVQLGRGLNSEECRLSVFVDGVQKGEPEYFQMIARAILQSRGEPDPDPHAPYPRPIIGSRSQLEVVSREMVETMRWLCREWKPSV